MHAEASKPSVSYKLNPLDEVLKGGPLEMEEVNDNDETNEASNNAEELEDGQEDMIVKHKKKVVKKKLSHKIKKIKKPKKQNKL